MPRLSVIIPHLSDEQQLNESLLSVLENRPQNTEVILVHDGRYQDPYNLSDEIVIIDAGSVQSVGELINAGVLSACAPVVNTVLEGVIVEAGWAEAAVERLNNERELAGVAVPIQRGSRTTHGLDMRRLNSIARWKEGQLLATRPPQRCAGPEVACGFFRKSVLTALEGFATARHPLVMQADFALCVKALGLSCELDAQDDAKVLAARERRDASVMTQLASVAAKHSIAPLGFPAALRELPFAWSRNRRCWMKGLLVTNRSYVSQMAERLSKAKQHLASRDAAVEEQTYRNAA